MPVEGQMRIWAHFQNEARESFARSHPRLDFLARQIKKVGRPPLRVLNVGIGDGYLEERLLAFGYEVCSLDLDAQSVERMTTRSVQAQVGLIEQMPFDISTFDVVVTSEVIEHLSDAQRKKALAEVHRVLRLGGVYFGTVPCEEDLQTGMCVCPQCGTRYHRWGHQRSFTSQFLTQELAPFFAVNRCYATAFPDFKRPLPGQVKAIIRVVLARFRVAIALPTIFWKATRKG